MKHEVATLGGGCFWCLEAIYQDVKGVLEVVSGYAGGKMLHPKYEAVCTGDTGHAEVVQISFDADVLNYETVLEIFWTIHDPTSLNAQGNDRGSQYRSVIFYHDEMQYQKAHASLKSAQKMFQKPIVTELLPLPMFYKAENYHQNYFKNNPHQGYCAFVIAPKVEHFKQAYLDKNKS